MQFLQLLITKEILNNLCMNATLWRPIGMSMLQYYFQLVDMLNGQKLCSFPHYHLILEEVLGGLRGLEEWNLMSYKKKKSKKRGDSRMRRQQKSIKCRKCGQEGHNRKTCTDPPTNDEPRRTENEFAVGSVNQPKRRKMKARIASTSSRSNVNSAVNYEPTTQPNVNKEKAVRPPSQSLGLVDEEDPDDLEALFSQASSVTQPHGMPTLRTVPGPTPLEQLQMTQGHNVVPHPRHIGVQIRASPQFSARSLRPHFTSLTGEEISGRRIFVDDGGHKFMDLSQSSNVSGKGKEK
ncbi:hypothetical protein ACS0TY_030924 [Phlomoides rotata]